MTKFVFVMTAALVAFLWAAQPLWAGPGHEHEMEPVNQEAVDRNADHDGNEGTEQDVEEAAEDHAENSANIPLEAAQAAGIVTSTVSAQMIGEIAPLTGQITINPNRRAVVRARFAGIVRSVKVKLGQFVQKGDVLAMVESSESLKDYPVRAPIDGIVLERNTNTGDVAGGDPMFVVVDLSEVWAKLHVFPKDADLIETGKPVRVYTIGEERMAHVRITDIFPTVDAPSQTLIAIAALSNDSQLWRPGMTVTGDVTVFEKQVETAVLRSALQTIEDQTVVFVKEGDVYEAVPVETGLDDGLYVEIKNGLQAGQVYVSEGSFIVKADVLKSGAEHSH